MGLKEEHQNLQHLIFTYTPVQLRPFAQLIQANKATMPGQARRPLAGSQKRHATDATGGIDGTTNEAIQILEAFIGASSVSPRIRDAWKRMGNAEGVIYIRDS